MLVNLSRVDVEKWIKKQENVYIGRRTGLLSASKWANPFAISSVNSRERVLELYEQYIRHNPVLLKDIHELKGKNLGCWCCPKACHGSILLQLVKETFEHPLLP